MSSRRSRRVSLAVPAALLLLVAGCGGGGGGGGATRDAVNGAVEVSARDISYDVETIKAPPGPLTVTLRENGSLPHTFTMDDKDFELKVDSGNKETSGTVELEAGKYPFRCTVPGHGKMKGTVEVG
jgi:plastocyanin